MMSKINSFFRSLYDTESKNGKTLREISMMIMRIGIWMITYGSFSTLFGDFFGFDFDSEVIAKGFNNSNLSKEFLGYEIKQ